MKFFPPKTPSHKRIVETLPNKMSKFLNVKMLTKKRNNLKKSEFMPEIETNLNVVRNKFIVALLSFRNLID